MVPGYIHNINNWKGGAQSTVNRFRNEGLKYIFIAHFTDSVAWIFDKIDTCLLLLRDFGTLSGFNFILPYNLSHADFDLIANWPHKVIFFWGGYIGISMSVRQALCLVCTTPPSGLNRYWWNFAHTPVDVQYSAWRKIIPVRKIWREINSREIITCTGKGYSLWFDSQF